MPALKATLNLLAILAGLNTVYFGWILVKRLQLPYNEEGRFFDDASEIVIQEQAIPGIAVLLAASLIVSLSLTLAGRKISKSKL